MSAKLVLLQERQHQLQLQAERERKALAANFEPWEKPLFWADRGVDVYQFLKSHPILWTSAFAALAHYKPKLASKVLAVGWGAMKLLRGAKKLL